jgi:phage baseplate assembly protein W
VTGAGDVLGRGISFPPRVGTDGRVVWSEGDVNIQESIQVILKTASGERLRLPGFGGGIEQFLFEPNTVATRFDIAERIRRAVSDWEPRVSVQSVEVNEDPSDPEAAVATIVYRLVATQAERQLSLAVVLRG